MNAAGDDGLIGSDSAEDDAALNSKSGPGLLCPAIPVFQTSGVLINEKSLLGGMRSTVFVG
jgi:hypothetical protein